MAKTDKNTIKSWFRNFLKPTQEQFWNWMDSYWHKEEKIPQDTIEGWDEFLQSLPSQGTLQNYLLKDASNLSDNEKTSLVEALHVLTQDHEKGGETIKGTGYTKQQVDTLIDNIDLTTKANKTADNLEENDIEKWKEKLGITATPEPEITQGSIIKFDELRDYGLATPLSTFEIDLDGAKRGNVQYVYFNGQVLPSIPQLKWVNGVNEYFQSGKNYLIELEYKDENNILANLSEYNA